MDALAQVVVLLQQQCAYYFPKPVIDASSIEGVRFLRWQDLGDRAELG
jgi:hypothetical protein